MLNKLRWRFILVSMISVAAAMAQKVVSAQIDANVQSSLVEETLREMGETTWQS